MRGRSIRGGIAAWAALMGAAAVGPIPLLGQSPVLVEDARDFLGSWVFAFDTPMGPNDFDFRILDENGDGTVEVRIGEAELLAEHVSWMGPMLSVEWLDQLGPQPAEITLLLLPDDDGLATSMDIGGGLFETSGTSVRSDSDSSDTTDGQRQ